MKKSFLITILSVAIIIALGIFYIGHERGKLQTLCESFHPKINLIQIKNKLKDDGYTISSRSNNGKVILIYKYATLTGLCKISTESGKITIIKYLPAT